MPVPRIVLPALAVLLCLLTACAGPAAPADEATTRPVPHARGTAEVPAAPQRIVVLEPVQLDTAVALGAIPVGTAVLSESTGVPAYLGEAAAAVPTVGTVAAPDLERIAALQPDLVLGTESRHAQLYDQLAAIAPTAFMASQADPWQDNVRFVGRTVGREAETDQLLRDYTDRCAEVAGAHGTEGRTAQLIRPRDGQLTLYGPTSFAGATLECAGFTIPPRDWEGSISVDLSPELVLQARADEVLVTAVDPAAPDAVPPSVTAVRDEAFPRLHVVDQSYWITGVGPLGGRRVLDDIDRILGG
ncbi:ABC transporter substrate-binding protein [Pseudonocardia sp. HH130630-07]|uniref:ABC transporter substrate-binding protein n=1 Tax=Pseudonocardia sp. HH130630-07 TaxID=1690815 RepID=UPI000814D276|nr:iron-siderophore ABC transporter substrate-binding protein [Pseudonocardia sp. HH130630-07]ANY05135.1 iron ABC transporter substrate-binding protein [Pseudonocardia sp. HH130630-07]